MRTLALNRITTTKAMPTGSHPKPDTAASIAAARAAIAAGTCTADSAILRHRFPFWTARRVHLVAAYLATQHKVTT